MILSLYDISSTKNRIDLLKRLIMHSDAEKFLNENPIFSEINSDIWEKNAPQSY